MCRGASRPDPPSVLRTSEKETRNERTRIPRHGRSRRPRGARWPACLALRRARGGRGARRDRADRERRQGPHDQGLVHARRPRHRRRVAQPGLRVRGRRDRRRHLRRASSCSAPTGIPRRTRRRSSTATITWIAESVGQDVLPTGSRTRRRSSTPRASTTSGFPRTSPSRAATRGTFPVGGGPPGHGKFEYEAGFLTRRPRRAARSSSRSARGRGTARASSARPRRSARSSS